MDTADNELLRRYAEDGSQAAFAKLVERRLNLVHSAAMRQTGGDFHRANEISQLVFISLARKSLSLMHHPSLVGWLYTSVFFEASKMRRAEQRRLSKMKGAAVMTEILHPEPAADWSQVGPVLDGAMLELSSRDRETVLWRFFNAEPLAAIGKRLGVSEDAARKRVERALERMRHQLRRQGLESTSAALAAILAEHAVVAAPAGLAESVTAGTLTAMATAGPSATNFWRRLLRWKSAAGASGALWVGGVLSIGALGTTTYELWAAGRRQTALAADEQAGEADRARLQQLVRSLAVTPRNLPGGHADRDARADFRRFLRDYPQSRTMLLANSRLFAQKLYGSFFRTAALTPLQIERMKDVMAESWFQDEIISPSEFVLTGRASLPIDQIREIIGQERCRQFEAYQRSAFAHYWATAAAGSVQGEVALTAEQVDQLAAILDTNATGSLEQQSALASLPWDAVMAQVRAKLPAAQWTAVEPMLNLLRAQAARKTIVAAASRANL